MPQTIDIKLKAFPTPEFFSNRAPDPPITHARASEIRGNHSHLNLGDLPFNAKTRIISAMSAIMIIIAAITSLLLFFLVLWLIFITFAFCV